MSRPVFSFMLWRNTTAQLIQRRNVAKTGWETTEKYGAAVDPGVGDDAADGYTWGSVWANTTGDKVWICTDPTTGAAVWRDIGAIPLGNVIWGGTAGGTANAHTISPSPAISAYAAGMSIAYIAPASSNTAAVTVAVSGLSARAVKTNDGYEVVRDDIPASSLVRIVDDGSGFRLAYPLPPRPNLAINGGMRIDQRNAGAEVIPAAGTYTLDMYYLGMNIGSKLGVQQISTSLPPAASHSLRVRTASAHTATATQFLYLGQPIEGSDAKHLGWGAAGAIPLAVSFMAKSTLTGNFAFSVCNSAATRSYVTTFNIPQASTWYRFALVIPGDVTGTWLTANGVIGIWMQWDCGSGSNFQTTDGQWGTGFLTRTSGSVNLVGTLNAELHITDLKAEPGSPTAYHREDVGTAGLRCRRFYQTVLCEHTGYVITSVLEGATISYSEGMAKTPTLTFAEQHVTGYPSGDPSTDYPTANGVHLYKTPNATGAGTFAYLVTADASLLT